MHQQKQDKIEEEGIPDFFPFLGFQGKAFQIIKLSP